MYKIALVVGVVMFGALNLSVAPQAAESCAAQIEKAEKLFGASQLHTNMKNKISNWLNKARDFNDKGKKKGCLKQVKKALAQLE